MAAGRWCRERRSCGCRRCRSSPPASMAATSTQLVLPDIPPAPPFQPPQTSFLARGAELANLLLTPDKAHRPAAIAVRVGGGPGLISARGGGQCGYITSPDQ